jgi:hypothetical protein
VTGSLAGLEASCAPNPCSDRGAITYLLPADGHVRLTLYDALGRQVATLADAMQTAGRHNAWFDASLLAPGVYGWMLECGGGRVGDRVVVVR